MTILAKDKRVVTVLAEKPDAMWDAETMSGLEAAFAKAVHDLQLGGSYCVPTPQARARVTLRHDFWTASAGVSYVAGQKVSVVIIPRIPKLTDGMQGPGNIKQTEHNAAVLETFLADPHVQRAMSHGNGALQWLTSI